MDFYRDDRNNDGRRSQCISCTSAYDRTDASKVAHKAYRQSEKGRATRRAYSHSEVGKAVGKAKGIKRNKLYPEKIKANNVVNRAVRTGKLTRPTDCSSCDNPNGRIEAHHPDYSKPLEVIWLCSSCHREEHIKLESGEKAGLPYGFKKMDDAPKDGTEIYGFYGDGDTAFIFWSDRPVCMLGSRNGGFPEGWATCGADIDYNLPMEEPLGWR